MRILVAVAGSTPTSSPGAARAKTGIDFSGRSIAYAKAAAAVEELEVILCDFCALSPAQRSVLLRKFHRILTPGGAVLLDVYSMAAFVLGTGFNWLQYFAPEELE